MNKKRRIICFSTLLVLISILISLTGCQKEEAGFEVLVFSSVPDSFTEEMKGLAKEFENMKVTIYPPVVERLIVEIARNKGDIFIMERELLAAVYDSEELYPLSNLANDTNLIELTEFELEAFLADGKQKEGVTYYDNALRVVNTTPHENELGEIELVTTIPKYITHKEDAFSVVEMLVKE